MAEKKPETFGNPTQRGDISDIYVYQIQGKTFRIPVDIPRYYSGTTLVNFRQTEFNLYLCNPRADNSGIADASVIISLSPAEAVNLRNLLDKMIGDYGRLFKEIQGTGKVIEDPTPDKKT